MQARSMIKTRPGQPARCRLPGCAAGVSRRRVAPVIRAFKESETPSSALKSIPVQRKAATAKMAVFSSGPYVLDYFERPFLQAFPNTSFISVSNCCSRHSASAATNNAVIWHCLCSLPTNPGSSVPVNPRTWPMHAHMHHAQSPPVPCALHTCLAPHTPALRPTHLPCAPHTCPARTPLARHCRPGWTRPMQAWPRALMWSASLSMMTAMLRWAWGA